MNNFFYFIRLFFCSILLTCHHKVHTASETDDQSCEDKTYICMLHPTSQMKCSHALEPEFLSKRCEIGFLSTNFLWPILISEILDGARSPVTHSPPLSMAAQLFGEKNFFAPFPINQDTLTPGPEHYTQQKNLPPIVSAMFQNSAAEKSGSACKCQKIREVWIERKSSCSCQRACVSFSNFYL